MGLCGTELCDTAAAAALDMHAVVRGKWEQDTSNNIRLTYTLAVSNSFNVLIELRWNKGVLMCTVFLFSSLVIT